MSTISASTTSTTAFKVTADTTGVLTLQTGVTPTTALTVGSDQSVTFAQAANLPNTFGFKNRIINGAMVIDQRNAGAAISTHGAFVVDRFGTASTNGSASGITVQQSTTVPLSSGFTNSIVYTVGTGGAVGASGSYGIQQRIEGYNFSDMLCGTASAKQFTLSFWVRSSLTGTFGVSFRNSAKDRTYIASYTINSANTWEYKTITITGDTSGTWLTNNGIGLDLFFDLGAGTASSTTANSWQAGNYIGLTGGVKLVETTGATFYITGVQLEKGSTATSFDYRPYGTELQLCYRYYYFLGGETAYQNINTCVWYGAGDAVGQFSYPVAMRANPTMAKSGTWATLGGGGAVAQTLSNDQITTKNVQLGFTGGSGGTSGQATTLRASNDTGLRLTFSAEL
jgi:hypothetical protein